LAISSTKRGNQTKISRGRIGGNSEELEFGKTNKMRVNPPK
jgi:hypothetical protein